MQCSTLQMTLKSTALTFPWHLNYLFASVHFLVSAPISAGMLRYWIGAGRGGFAISPTECLTSSFYCIMTTLKEGSPTLNPGSDYLRGRKVKTSPIPARDPYFAVIKSNNYLPNVLATMDAEAEKLDYVSYASSLPTL